MPLEDVSRGIVRELFASVVPFDEVERAQQVDALGWIDAGHPLFRVNAQVDPPKHLAVYFAVLDDIERTLMVVDHRKARAQLLPGGHVDPDEDPRFTVVREADEELRLTAKFHDITGDAPLFLSVTTTRGAHSHTDVTLWFVLAGSRSERIEPDPGEFAGVHWRSLDSTDWSSEHFDPHMARFAAKLRATLDR